MEQFWNPDQLVIWLEQAAAWVDNNILAGAFALCRVPSVACGFTRSGVSDHSGSADLVY